MRKRETKKAARSDVDADFQWTEIAFDRPGVHFRPRHWVSPSIRTTRRAISSAAASGGVWKTVNTGTTWTPVFDNEGSYSIGAIALDPKNPLTVWVGTGENNSQRSVSYGNGVYRSDDGGKTLEERRSENFRAHRPHRDRSERLEHRLRRRAGTAVGTGRRSRTLQNHRRRQDLEEAFSTISENTGVTDVVIDPNDPEHALRRVVSTPPSHVDA